jgi:phosphomannomutase
MLLKARAEGDTRGCAVVATVVSSAAVGKMAEIEGFEYHQTATGFKNIGATGIQLKHQVR